MASSYSVAGFRLPRSPAVERYAGRQFSPEQIAMAVDGRPDRLITIDVED